MFFLLLLAVGGARIYSMSDLFGAWLFCSNSLPLLFISGDDVRVHCARQGAPCVKVRPPFIID